MESREVASSSGYSQSQRAIRLLERMEGFKIVWVWRLKFRHLKHKQAQLPVGIRFIEKMGLKPRASSTALD
jgi:hypothetical protein